MNDKKSTDETSSEESENATDQPEEQDTQSGPQDESCNIPHSTQIIFSAPFRTDIVLDSKELLGKYKDTRQDIENKLSCTTQFSGWVPDPHIDEDDEKGNFGIISPDKPGRAAIPPYFLGFTIKNENGKNNDKIGNLQDKLRNELNSKISAYLSKCKKQTVCDVENSCNCNFHISKVKIKFFEFGFGAITVYVTMCKEQENNSALRYAIESDEIKEILDSFILGLINQYEKNVPKKYITKPEYAKKRESVEPKPKKLYWTHRLISFSLESDLTADTENGASSENISEAAKLDEDKFKNFLEEKRVLLTQSIILDSEQEITKKILDKKGQIFIPGVGNSILLLKVNEKFVIDDSKKQNETKFNNYLTEEIDRVSDIIAITGTFAAFMHYFHERFLYFVDEIFEKSKNERKKRFNIFSTGMKEIFNDILEQLEVSSRIDFLFYEYESLYLSSIGKGAYEEIIKVWKFDKQWEGLKEQINDLRDIYERNDDFISRRQQRHLNILVLIFAASSGIPNLSKAGKFVIDNLETDIIITILCIVALSYLACRTIYWLIKKYMKRLCYIIIACCKNLQKNED